MSGRKASEVSSLLSRGEQARVAGEKNFYKIIKDNKENIINNKCEISKIVNEINNSTLDFSSEVCDEFPKEVAQMKKEFINIKQEISVKNYNLSSIDKDITEIKNIIKKADEESNQLRNIIRTKPHYCDREYERADLVVKQYKEANYLKSKVKEKLNSINNESEVELINVEFAKKQIQILSIQKANLDRKAKEIIKLRNESNKAREYIENLVNNIDSNVANKFMPKEYKEILTIKNNFISFSNSEVVKNLNDVSEKIGIFNNKLNIIYEEFKAKKAEAIEVLNNLKKAYKKDKFYDPMDFVKNGDKAKEIDLAIFLNSYLKGKYVNDIENGISKVEELIEKENFEESNREADNITKLIEEAAYYSSIKQENLLKNTYIALDIRNVMRRMNYKTNAKIINNDITNGFRITCEIGDELIDFDKVLVDDEGKVTIDIDHTEEVGGTCATKWPDITNELANVGIFIKDIKKDGRSIFKSNTSKKNEEERKTN